MTPSICGGATTNAVMIQEASGVLKLEDSQAV